MEVSLSPLTPPVEWTHLWFKVLCYLSDCNRPTCVRNQNRIIFEVFDRTCTVFSQRALPTLSALFTVSVFVQTNYRLFSEISFPAKKQRPGTCCMIQKEGRKEAPLCLGSVQRGF